MSNLLSTAKKVLKEGSIEFYICMSEDLPLEKNEFKRHFGNLGEVICEIDSVNSFSELISKMEKGDFEMIGYFPGDDDMLEEFLKAVKEAQ